MKTERPASIGTVRVSCVLPVYNGMEYLELAVQSVLAQSLPDFELVLLDDGSTDGSTRLCRDLAATDARIRLIEKPNTGLVDTLNFGVREARGDYIARMDADDICMPERFARQVDFLDSHPEVAAVGSRVEVIDGAGRTTNLSHGNRWRMDRGAFPSGGIALCHPTVMFRRAAFLQTRGYSEIFHAAEDYALWMEMAKLGEMTELADRLLRYRVHEASVSSTKLDQQRFSCLKAELIDEALRRCRDHATVREEIEAAQGLDSILSVVRTHADCLPSLRAVEVYFLGQKVRRMANRCDLRESLPAWISAAAKTALATPGLFRRKDSRSVMISWENLGRALYAMVRRRNA